MKGPYERRIARAGELSRAMPESAGILEFYSRLAGLQARIYEEASGGSVENLARYFAALAGLLPAAGAQPLVDFAARKLRGETERRKLLRDFWEGGAGERFGGTEQERFFARVLAQPYAEARAAAGAVDSRAGAHANRCPACGARPVAGVLRPEGDGGKRGLVCSMCATEWDYRRILCPSCGEENRDKLPVFVAESCPYVRVEACDTCKTYLKSIDLTKNGLAVPVVDELATVSIGIWAEEQGYAKGETNLLGM